MWERFCVNLHGICRDGHPDNSDHLCCLWDTLVGECVMVKSMQGTADNQRLAAQLMQMRMEHEERLRGKAETVEKKPE